MVRHWSGRRSAGHVGRWMREGMLQAKLGRSVNARLRSLDLTERAMGVIEVCWQGQPVSSCVD